MRRSPSTNPFLLFFGLLLPVVGYQVGASAVETVNQFATIGFLLVAILLGAMTHTALQQYTMQEVNQEA